MSDQHSAGPIPAAEREQPGVGRSFSGENETQRVFISYRRSDCQPQANGLHDGLRHRLPSASVFMDIDSIPPGVDFEQHIRREIEICDLVLVLVGDNWLDPRPGATVRRIDEPDDFVRLEIESALASPGVRVVPVLVEGAQMPRASELPESISKLARINAIELSDGRWTADLTRLADLIARIAGEKKPQERNMRLSDVDADVIAAAIAALPPTFCTQDVSENPQVLAAHRDVKDISNYHAMMGRYLAKNHAALGLRPPEPPINDRGSVWHKEPAMPPTAFAPVQPPPRRENHSGLLTTPVPTGEPTAYVGWLMVALPWLTCGLASCAPAIWAATRRRHDLVFRRRMLGFAAVVGVLSIGGFIMLIAGPTDATGTPSGPISDTGGFTWFASVVAATIVAVIYRKPGPQLPGTALELARRAQREQYRTLIKRDHALATSIHVGRPDLPRDYSDGGLLDLNAVSIDSLVRFGPMSPEEAARIVATRDRIGRLASLEEVIAYADLSETTVARLRETAIFL